MNTTATKPGPGPIGGPIAPRPGFRPIAGARTGKPRPLSWIMVMAFILAHLPLALLMKFVPALATVHALLALVVGLVWAMNGRAMAKVAYVGAYITGSEVMWRAVGASVFWEFGKYACILIFVLALARHRRFKLPALPTAFFLLLIPATLLTLFQVSPSDAKDMISFNLSGPLALAVSVVFFMNMKMSGRQLVKTLIAFIAPVAGMVAIIVLGLASSDVKFGRQSNEAASGGFGANQVSALLGMACVAAFLCLLDSNLRWQLKVLFFGFLLEFAVQSALTFSRAGIYYTAVSIAVGALLSMKNLRSAFQMSLILAAFFLVAYYVVFPRLDDFTGGALSARFENTRLSGRAEIMDADLKIMAEHPIFGIGVGQAKSERARFFKGFASHTEFTRLLSEHGTFGCVALVLLIAMAIKNVVAAGTSRGRAVAATLATYSFCFMTGNGMRMVLPSFIFGLAAVGLAAARPPLKKKIAVPSTTSGRFRNFPRRAGLASGRHL